MFNKFLYIFLILFTCYLPPLFCGGDSESGDGFDNEDDDVDGTGIEIFGIPILFPYVDYHRGRKLIQLPPKLAPFVPIFEKDNLLSKINKEVSDDKIPDPEILDEYNRKIYSLNHGDPNNPYLILDHGTLNIGILGGISFSDTQTYVLQYNLLAKIFYTSGGWSEREADSYNEAKNLKQLKVPSKAKDFDSWNNGDDMYINGSMVISIYAGISAYIADARAGGILMGNWSKHITKLDNNLVRIAFTKEGGFGVAARIQALPLTKIEGKKLKDWEGTLVFDFDRSTEDGKKALKHALNNRILLKKQDTDEDNVTLLTTRTSGRNKSSRNLQIGMPFIARARASYHKINISQETINERNNKKTTIASKGYMKQKAYRYVNIPKNNKDKKWQHFTYTNFHYNKISEGCAKVVKNDTTKEIKRSDIKLAVEISFTHDKVKVKEADDYKKDIAKQVGINNFVIDLGYEKDYQIGYVGLTYRLNVNTEALDAIIEKAVEDKHLFDEPVLSLINKYFIDNNDPHNICRGQFTNRNLCIELVKINSKRKLDKIASYLRKLDKPKNIYSKSSSSSLLANIAKILRTNQFVLQSFISMLPENNNGYGTFEIEGEKFLGKKFIVDPNNQREIFDSVEDPLERFGRNDDEDMI